ncbi:MAG: 2-aminoethylphosphonate--pyruvate transaminase [Fluviicola sp.]|nr:2-aminoethylphosphonate--pyruvate transaminase [Fluviicola sp.]
MKKLFTPGPLNTSLSVKQAMLTDVGSRDLEFIEAVQFIRYELLDLAQVDKSEYTTVIIQGSGTFGIESVIGSVVGEGQKLLVMTNGAYGDRMVKMASVNDINVVELPFQENETLQADRLEILLHQDPSITHVACVHSETTTGLFNPIEEIGQVCKRFGKVFIVDAMSSFGGVQLKVKENCIHFLVSSSNKCIEGTPGFSFAICDLKQLQLAKDQAKSLSLDLYAQWKGLETNGQFRFTPPTLTIMAFKQALIELKEEGGIVAREARYKSNRAILKKELHQLGLIEYLPESIQGHIITSYLYPEHPNFDFDRFYQKLNERNLVIYPGKLSHCNAFRIGNIGQLFEQDMMDLVNGVREVLSEEGILIAQSVV